MKYAWIDQQRDSFPIAVMCDVLKVSKSGYYSAQKRSPTPRAERTARIQASVQQVHAQSHGIYGSQKITAELQQRDDLEVACRNTVARAMRDLGLTSKVVRRFKPPTTTQADPTKAPAPNVLERDFTAVAPNRKWVTDITYLRIVDGWVYLAVVLDLFSRKVVGWALRDSLETELISAALQSAVESRRPAGQELLHHSDRGCQYTSDAYQSTLRTLGIQCSMSRTGDCYDNAVMERFFWSLKHEWTNHESYEDLNAARLSVFKYIETFYNTKRLHQTLGYKTPHQFEAEFAPANTAA
jgi:putative transposase